MTTEAPHPSPGGRILVQKIDLMVVDATFLGKAPNRERQLFQLCYWTKQQGVSVRMVTTAAGRSQYLALLPADVSRKIDFIRIPFSRDYDSLPLLLIPFEYLKRIIGSFFIRLDPQTQVVYAVSPLIVDVAVALRMKFARRSVKVAINYDNFVPPPSERPGGHYVYKLIPYLAFRITLFFLRFADGMPSYMSAPRVRQLSKLFDDKKKTMPLTNGLDLDFIRGIPDEERKEYDIVYLGRLHPAKGIFDLLHLIKELAKNRPHVRACLIGPVEPVIKTEMDEFIARNGLQGNIEMKGFVGTKEKYQLLKKSRIFVFFSHDDSSPISVVEAIACKLPLVLYDLEVYAFKPFKEAYREIFKMGDFMGAVAYVRDILENYDSRSVEIEDFYRGKSIVISSSENASKELNFLREMVYG